MEFSYDNSWDSLTTLSAAKLSAKEAWIKFIDFHEDTIPKPYWSELKQLDLESDQTEIVAWLEQLFSASPMPESVGAIWIGILKYEEDDKEIQAIHLIGADDYEKDDNEWACDPTYLPENRYFVPKVLQQIDEISQTDEDNYSFLDWILPLAYCTFMFDEIIRTKLNKTLFSTNKHQINVVTGHDSGDFIEISSVVVR